LASSSANPLSQFRIKVSPSIKEIEAWVEKTWAEPAVAVDVETAHGQIRTISFSHGPKEAFVVPFWEPPAPSTWSSPVAEAHVWGLVRRAFANPHKTYIFHNGAYDIQYIWRVHGIPILGVIHDTMVAHWALEPELPKGLGQLAAVYLKLPEWKSLNRKTEKEED
jgi:DNA polymerase I-like protein with 3'-5' exonuclease and polymerase domains